MKYQFCIRFHNIDVNSAASKAVLDCNKIFHTNGYRDYTFTVGDNTNKKTYYYLLAKELITFFLAIRRGSVVGIQYPLLSVNSVFKHFIRLARLKKVKFFCVVHDLESLRTGGKNQQLISEEVNNLNQFDVLIVHNDKMLQWLKNAGITTKMVPLKIFDYLSPGVNARNQQAGLSKRIVYAGNLSKSTFIYSLGQLNVRFNIYGPGFSKQLLPPGTSNITWGGVFNPDEIAQKIDGSFGLIWDGSGIDKCDEILGNYLIYNNPHKCSLYIAAGLPLIAPSNSAIGYFIQQHKIGVVINSLFDLDTLAVTEQEYGLMLSNIAQIQAKISTGFFFTEAIHLVENELIKN